MYATIRKLLRLLTRRERLQLYLLFVAIAIMAGMQVISIAAIWPFLAVATDPAAIEDNAYLLWAYETFGFRSSYQFLMWLGVTALLVLIVSNAFIIATTWAKMYWANMRNHTLSWRLLAHYLRQPYPFFLQRSSSDLSTLVLSEVKDIVDGLIQPGLQALLQSVVALTIIGFLIAVDPLLALIAAATLGGAYVVIFFLVQRWLTTIGQAKVNANKARFNTAQEAFGGIKEVKLLGKEQTFADRYKNPSYDYARHRTTKSVIAIVPKYAFEAVAFGGLLVIVLYLLSVGSAMREIIPTLGIYAFGAYRLMPALHHMFKGAADFKFSAPALDFVYAAHFGDDSTSNGAVDVSEPKPLPLCSSLALRGVSFSYFGAETPALKDISFVIQANTTVGIVGPTGAGKSTLVDIILGLLRPSSGDIVIDDKVLDDEHVHEWQRNIGYVPQEIYLSDTTVAKNIAFAEKEEDIDQEAVRRAAKVANIHEFIENELADQYDSEVGERGVRLSGGQRQRIGIARALYHNPDVLVLDEATSSVDMRTERNIMDAVYELSGQKTIIMIAHRVKTLERCDNILQLEQGELVGKRSYREVSSQ